MWQREEMSFVTEEGSTWGRWKWTIKEQPMGEKKCLGEPHQVRGEPDTSEERPLVHTQILFQTLFSE